MYQRITIVGDMMCEPRLLKAARKRGGYDFGPVFEPCAQMFQKADLLVGNLETPIAGLEAGYTDSLFSFNAPIDFAKALKKAGFGLVLTANNHCLDRGVQGMENTIHSLDEIGLPHTGMFLGDAGDRAADFDLGKTRIRVFSCTYGTNYNTNRVLLKGRDRCSVNLLQSQQGHIIPGDVDAKRQSLLKRAICQFTTHEQRIWLKRKLGMQYYRAYRDDLFDKADILAHLKEHAEIVADALASGRAVVACPHVGGQFNGEPGALTKYVFDWFSAAGVSAVVASHPHVVQRACMSDGVPLFFSLGNACMSPSSIYLLPENKPAYGIAAHLIFNEGKIVDSRFSILKSVEDSSGMLRVFPVNQLYDKTSRSDERAALLEDISFILMRVLGRLPEGELIREEYSLKTLASGKL